MHCLLCHHHTMTEFIALIFSEQYRPKSPRITSQVGEKAEKLICHTFGRVINESEYI